MSQAIAGEDALDGADGGERSEAIFVEESSYGIGSTGQPSIVEMEPFHDNDLFDLVAGVGSCGAFDHGGLLLHFAVEKGSVQDLLL